MRRLNLGQISLDRIYGGESLSSEGQTRFGFGFRKWNSVRFRWTWIPAVELGCDGEVDGGFGFQFQSLIKISTDFDLESITGGGSELDGVKFQIHSGFDVLNVDRLNVCGSGVDGVRTQKSTARELRWSRRFSVSSRPDPTVGYGTFLLGFQGYCDEGNEKIIVYKVSKSCKVSNE